MEKKDFYIFISDYNLVKHNNEFYYRNCFCWANSVSIIKIYFGFSSELGVIFDF
ncbi:MAG: hypothetical protein FD155_3390 [Bacteroidetes bacterium]|nr:MAG: hypothetical protein FD155_3390 [Bacteroidota bacterium]